MAWTSQLDTHFVAAKKYLANTKTVTISKAEDKLWIVTDGAQKLPGIRAAMFITRGSKRHLSGHYSAKLHKRQLGWIPCEIEALAITASVSHFCPYIIQSKLQTCILTDSKPCVDAFAKLCRGEFSLSSRVMTYLSTVSVDINVMSSMLVAVTTCSQTFRVVMLRIVIIPRVRYACLLLDLNRVL